MSFKLKCLPVGALAYNDLESAVRMEAKLFDKSPFLAELPNIYPNDTILNRTLYNIPGIAIENNKIQFKTGSKEYQLAIQHLEKTFNNPQKNQLDTYAIETDYFEKFKQLIKKFKSPYACINLIGPFTLGQMLNKAAEEQVLADKSFRKLFIQAICIKALWAIETIRDISPDTTPIIILEEPLFSSLGDLKRENESITPELVTNIFAKVIDKLKPTGALIAIQCMEKCDWKIPINAGADIISFDAYNNPNNLCIIPDEIKEFLERGGKINWGIIPTMTESLVKSLNIDAVEKRLLKTFEGLVLAGIPRELVYNNALVSIQGDASKLPIIFAEKTIMLAVQLSKRIRHIK